MAEQSLQGRAYRALKDAILAGEMRSRERISESDWAERLGTSRTPVREALQRLEYERLVDNEGRRGWFIHPISLDDIHRIFDIKESLEGLAAEQAAERITDRQASLLATSLREMEAAADMGDLEAWWAADKVFHTIIFTAAGNDHLERIVGGLNDLWHRLRSGHLAIEGRMKRSVEEHRLIERALAAHNGAVAREAVYSHLAAARRSLVNVLESMVIPLAGPRI